MKVTVIESGQEPQQDQQPASTQCGQQGDANVTVIQPSEAEIVEPEQRRERLTQEQTYALLGIGGRQVGDPTEILTVTVSDLSGRNVQSMTGEKIGEIDRLVSNDGQIFAIIAHRGFLGIGEDKVAIPAGRLGIQGEEIVLIGMTEDQLKGLPEFEFGSGQDLAIDQPVEIGRYE